MERIFNMSLITTTQEEPKVHFSEYIRIQNDEKPDTQPEEDTTEPTKPTTPEAE